MTLSTVVLALTLFQQPCDLIGPAALGPADSVYAEAAALARELAPHGVQVRCFYHTTMDGWLGEKDAVGFATDSSTFTVYFFASPEDAARLRVTERVGRHRLPCPPYRDTTWYRYEVSGVGRPRGPRRLWEGFQRAYVVRHDRSVIVLFDARTAARISQALTPSD